MIEQRKDEIFEVVNDLEKVLDNLRDASISLPIQRAIDVLMLLPLFIVRNLTLLNVQFLMECLSKNKGKHFFASLYF